MPLSTNKLNANENVYGAPKVVLDAIQVAEHHIYPDPAQINIRAALAAYHHVSIDNVVAGCGSDDLLDVLIRIVGPKKIIISTPTFGMYRYVAKASYRIQESSLINICSSSTITFQLSWQALWS